MGSLELDMGPQNRIAHSKIIIEYQGCFRYNVTVIKAKSKWQNVGKIKNGN